MPDRLSQFWQELKRRRVIPFVIGYVAACFAIIEFVLNASQTFSLPEKTIRLLYPLSAIGIPIVFLIPWFLNRKRSGERDGRNHPESEPGKADNKKSLHNLPAQLTTFIGREKEMKIVKELISEHRLVTLTGAGGCGKTRLACEVSIQLVSEYKDGVWFVDFSPVTTNEMVAREIMEVLGITEAPDRSLVESLIEQAKDKNMLVVFDNCEHVVSLCAEIAGKLLKALPGMKILATSREPLLVIGEQVWRVPSLTLLDPKTVINIENAAGSEAVIMFTERARLKNPEFELESANVSEVVTICNKLDGIPLAIELVASRIRHLQPGMMLERFGDRFDRIESADPGVSKRHMTLQAAIEWSYNLLSDSERILFARLSVFSGGFDLEAAEDICSDKILLKENILEGLSRLVDRSLIHTVNNSDKSIRYNRLETLRQYALAKLKSLDEEESIRSRHLKYYTRMAEQAYEEQYEEQLRWSEILEIEHDNLISALNWAEDHSHTDFLALTGALAWFWRNHSHIMVARVYLKRAISGSGEKDEIYARNLFGLAMMTAFSADSQKMQDLMKESLEIWRRCGNRREEAYVLSEISEAYSRNGDFETSLRYCKESLRIAKEVGNPHLINYCLIYICQNYVHSKQFEKGQPMAEELLRSSEELNHIYGIEAARHFLGDCALGLRRFNEAEEKYAKGVETGLKYGYVWLAAADMQGVAFALSGQSRLQKAIRLSAAACQKMDEMEAPIAGMFEFWDEWIETYIEGARKKLGEQRVKQYEEDPIAMGFDKAVAYTLDFKKDLSKKI
ncbi:MAG: NB-ARC domain-containing protein [Bacteroidales bacterium]